MTGLTPPVPRLDIPALARISDYVDHWAAARPGAAALWLDGVATDWADLKARVDAQARALLAAGVRKGDRVATLSTPHPEFWVEFLATASIGAIWQGLNPRYQYGELHYAVDDASPSLLLARTAISGRDFRPELERLRAEVPSLTRLVALEGDPPPEGGETLASFLAAGAAVSTAELAAARAGVDPGDPALIVYTSGSTGRPKGALLPHRGLVRCSRVQLGYWHADPLCVLNFFPINHIGCVGDISCFALVGGGTIVFLEQFDPVRQMELIGEARITLWGGVPTTLQLALALPDLGRYDLSSLQTIAWSGAACPREVAERLRALCPRLSNAYGMTETVGSVTFVPPSDDLDVLCGSVGWPVPEYELRLVDPESGAEGDHGEIQVRGDFTMLGYWQRPEATAATLLPDGWLRTGDLARRNRDGTLTLIGRSSEMFKSGGYNCYPREIETALESHPAVAVAAVVSVPDPLYAEIGHAFVVLHPGAAADEADLKAHARGLLANYKVPKRIVVETELPMLPIGKVDKRALKARAVAAATAVAATEEGRR